VYVRDTAKMLPPTRSKRLSRARVSATPLNTIAQREQLPPTTEMLARRAKEEGGRGCCPTVTCAPMVRLPAERQPMPRSLVLALTQVRLRRNASSRGHAPEQCLSGLGSFSTTVLASLQRPASGRNHWRPRDRRSSVCDVSSRPRLMGLGVMLALVNATVWTRLQIVLQLERLPTLALTSLSAVVIAVLFARRFASSSGANHSPRKIVS
jgi:hypothetical protein